MHNCGCPWEHQRVRNIARKIKIVGRRLGRDIVAKQKYCAPSEPLGSSEGYLIKITCGLDRCRTESKYQRRFTTIKIATKAVRCLLCAVIKNEPSLNCATWPVRLRRPEAPGKYCQRTVGRMLRVKYRVLAARQSQFASQPSEGRVPIHR